MSAIHLQNLGKTFGNFPALKSMTLDIANPPR
jgi:ABC-type sugar transport system ATPase subunit